MPFFGAFLEPHPVLRFSLRVFIIVCGLGWGGLRAEDTQTTASLRAERDSLWQLYPQQTGEDQLNSLRELYLTYAQAFLEPDSVLLVVNLWAEAAAKQGNAAHLLMAEFGEAVYYDLMGDSPEALRRAYRVAKYAAALKLDSIEIKAWDRIGYLEMERGVYEKSLDAFGRGQLLADRMDDSEWQIYMANGKSYIYLLLADTAASIANSRWAWQQTQRSNLRGFDVEISLSLATLYTKVSKLDSAQFYLEHLEEDTLYAQRYRGIYDAHWANFYEAAGKQDSALHFFEKSLINMDPELDFHDKAIMQLDFAELLVERGQIARALSQAKAALSAFETLMDTENLLLSHILLEQIYDQLNQPDRQIYHLRQYQLLNKAYLDKRNAERLTAQQELLESKQAAYWVKQQRKQREKRELKESYFYTYAVFFGLCMLIALVAISLRFRVKLSWLEGLSFMLTILFFEGIIMFIDPYVANYTDGRPLPTLMVNGVLAILLTLLHTQLLRWMLRSNRVTSE